MRTSHTPDSSDLHLRAPQPPERGTPQHVPAGTVAGAGVGVLKA